MSWRDAPLYVEASDLACWVLGRIDAWPERGGRQLAPLVATGACDLATQVALALTFPGRRAAHLEHADNAIVRLRILLRLAQASGLLSQGGLRFACDRLQAIGRMVGGWRKRVAKSSRHPGTDSSSEPTSGETTSRNPTRGDGPPAAAGA